MGDDRNEQIRERAYRIWQEEGEPEGRESDHWSQAEREIGEARETAEPLSTDDAETPPKPAAAV